MSIHNLCAWRPDDAVCADCEQDVHSQPLVKCQALSMLDFECADAKPQPNRFPHLRIWPGTPDWVQSQQHLFR